MRPGPRALPALVLAAGGLLLLGGCDDADDEPVGEQDIGDEDIATAAADPAGSADDDDDRTAAPVAPPTEPMELELEPGERSASQDGGTITVEGERVAFVLPTGNIACVLTTGSATCQIEEKDYTPPADQLVPDLVGPCAAEDVNAMRTIRESGAWTCVAEDLVGDASLSAGGWWGSEVDGETMDVDGETVAVLPYGQRLQLGPVWCQSSEAGVTCANPELDGRRIELSRGSYAYDRNA